MEEISTIQEDQGYLGDGPAGEHKQAGDDTQPEQYDASRGPSPGGEPDQERFDHEAPSSGQPGPTQTEGTAAGQPTSQGEGGPGGNTGFHDQSGFQASSEMPGGWTQGPGPQQMGPTPEPGLHSGPFVHSSGFYGNPMYGPHMGGPAMGPSHQHGGFPHHAGMYWHPHQGPPMGYSGGPGPGHTGAPHQGAGGEDPCQPFADVMGKALQGQATPQDLIGGLLNLNFQGDQFWKGVVVGSVAALLLNSDAVRQTLAGALGGVFGNSGATTQEDDKSD